MAIISIASHFKFKLLSRSHVALPKQKCLLSFFVLLQTSRQFFYVDNSVGFPACYLPVIQRIDSFIICLHTDGPMLANSMAYNWLYRQSEKRIESDSSWLKRKIGRNKKRMYGYFTLSSQSVGQEMIPAFHQIASKEKRPIWWTSSPSRCGRDSRSPVGWEYNKRRP